MACEDTGSMKKKDLFRKNMIFKSRNSPNKLYIGPLILARGFKSTAESRQSTNSGFSLSMSSTNSSPWVHPVKLLDGFNEETTDSSEFHIPFEEKYEITEKILGEVTITI